MDLRAHITSQGPGSGGMQVLTRMYTALAEAGGAVFTGVLSHAAEREVAVTLYRYRRFEGQ
jgi:hypothetical protein